MVLAGMDTFVLFFILILTQLTSLLDCCLITGCLAKSVNDIEQSISSNLNNESYFYRRSVYFIWFNRRFVWVWTEWWIYWCVECWLCSFFIADWILFMMLHRMFFLFFGWTFLTFSMLIEWIYWDFYAFFWDF